MSFVVAAISASTSAQWLWPLCAAASTATNRTFLAVCDVLLECGEGFAAFALNSQWQRQRHSVCCAAMCLCANVGKQYRTNKCSPRVFPTVRSAGQVPGLCALVFSLEAVEGKSPTHGTGIS